MSILKHTPFTKKTKFLDMQYVTTSIFLQDGDDADVTEEEVGESDPEDERVRAVKSRFLD